MRKYFLFLIFFSTFILSANENIEQEQFQVVAKHIDYQDDIITATGEVIMFSPTYYITAQKIIYNKKKNQVDLYDNVNILKDNKNLSISNYSFMEFDVSSFSDVVFLLYENNLWIESSAMTSKGDDVFLEESYMSSCDCNNPDWSIKFSSGAHYDKYSWLQTFNNRLYIKNIPVLYFPYFAFYTNTERHSGFLMPTISYGSKEGLSYIQPYYYAPTDDFDLEFVPQYRANRGNGLYTYLRYADSPDSMLKMSYGHFKEKKSFQEEHELKNQDHYGFTLNYERANIFASKEHQDGFYANLDFLRDIEYKTLEERSNNNNSSYKSEDDDNDSYPSKIESKINYFYKTNDDYFGTYLRYYKNTSDSSETAKLTQQREKQKLPVLHYHKFSTPLIAQNFLYSMDANFTNYHRTKGLKAKETTMSLPFFYGTSLFDDYINISLQEEIFFAYLSYDENDLTQRFDNGRYFQLRHSATVSTNLIKAYDTFIHTMNLGTTLYLPSDANTKGDLYDITNDDTTLRDYPVTETRKNLSFWLSQSFYHRDFATLFLNHKIKQSVLYDGDGNSRLGNLENEIYFYHRFGSISNRLLYNHEDNKLIQSSSALRLAYDNYFFNTRHYWTQKTPNSNKKDSESISYEVGFKFWKHYRLSYLENYNILNKLVNKKQYKLTIDRGCWYLNFSVADELVSSSRIDNKPLRQDVIYFFVELRPIGGIDHEYKIKDKVNDE
jgi:LPS-assembly protein